MHDTLSLNVNDRWGFGMNNYDGRRVVNADVGLNAFMTKMFAWMGLAVLVSQERRLQLHSFSKFHDEL